MSQFVTTARFVQVLDRLKAIEARLDVLDPPSPEEKESEEEQMKRQKAVADKFVAKRHAEMVQAAVELEEKRRTLLQRAAQLQPKKSPPAPKAKAELGIVNIKP